MHTCIASHGLKRSSRSCPRRVNASKKNTPSTHHPRRRNVTTLNGCIKKNGHIRKISPKNGEPQRYSWETNKQTKKKPVRHSTSHRSTQPSDTAHHINLPNCQTAHHINNNNNRIQSTQPSDSTSHQSTQPSDTAHHINLPNRQTQHITSIYL